MGIAVNDGKKYPKKPLLAEVVEPINEEQTAEDMERIARSFTALMGGEIDGR